jgi:Cu(I)/Ag(I) efflux system membrane protein CusA/SilA
MTIATDIAGLMPILLGAGSGVDVMQRIATPIVGGLITSGIMELAIYPIVFYLWRCRGLEKGEKFRGFQHHKEIA